ncbi:YcgN family cysteine cluster protein [Porticoccus sp.]
MVKARFWEQKALSELSQDEWESLCDGCGKCCLHKLEDEESGDVFYTDVACQLLDLHSCRCSDYGNRLARVPDCLELTPAQIDSFDWLPVTCAYRLLADGQPLPSWHHLESGDRESIHRAGMSVQGRAIAEQRVATGDLEEHIVHWVE